MLKLRIALGLGLFVGGLTLTIGILHDTRPLTILYRVAISAILFSCVGYGLGIMFENFLKDILVKLSSKGNNVDIVTQQEEVNEGEKASEFSPFNSTDFEHISRPEE